jgi:ribosome biogenesis protein UTP30
LKASSDLIKHIKSSEKEDSTSKPDLLAGADNDEEEDDEATPVWLTLTTKKHIIDQKRLKPAKLTVPHPLNTSANTTICLITSDPQRTYKDIIASPAFPSALAARITRVVGITKLKAKWSQYEAQRKLLSEHDIFLADDRIITMLSKTLGKTFYKSSAKRPIPVDIAAPAARTDGKKIARAKSTQTECNPGTPKDIAAEIEKAIQSAVIHLSPSTNTAVKVGYSSWDEKKLAENVEAVANGLIEKFVPKKWRNVRALHIKGPETAALPIWLADEMWENEEDVVKEDAVVPANVGKKRKAKPLEREEIDQGGKPKQKDKKQKLLESNDDNLDKEIALRKEKLKKQKAEAAKDVEEDIPKATKKSKKGKAKVEVGI